MQLRITVNGIWYAIQIHAYLNEPWAQPWELTAWQVENHNGLHVRAGGHDFNTALENLVVNIRKALAKQAAKCAA